MGTTAAGIIGVGEAATDTLSAVGVGDNVGVATGIVAMAPDAGDVSSPDRKGPAIGTRPL